MATNPFDLLRLSVYELDLPPGGYEYDFLSPVPVKWVCLICQLPLRNPVQIISCGHRICRRCMDEVLRRPRAVCPADRVPIEPDEVFLDAGCKRDVEGLQVKCPKGPCTWTGEVREAEERESGSD